MEYLETFLVIWVEISCYRFFGDAFLEKQSNKLKKFFFGLL